MSHRPRLVDATIVLLSTGALILLGSLRGVFAALPLIPFLSTLVLFMAPGVLLPLWFLTSTSRCRPCSGVSFAISTETFGLLEGVQILRRYEADYVLVRVGSPLDGRLRRLCRGSPPWMLPGKGRACTPWITRGSVDKAGTSRMDKPGKRR